MIDIQSTGTATFTGYGKAGPHDVGGGRLGTHGAAIETLAALGLPVPIGVSIPVDAHANADWAAAVDVLQQLAGARVGSRLGAAGDSDVLALRLRASAPVQAAGLPPDLVCLGLDPGAHSVPGAGGDRETLEAQLYTVRLIAELALGVPAPELAALAMDVADPGAQLSELLAVIERHAGVGFPPEPAAQVTLAATAMIARWASPRAARARRTQSLPADLALALHLEAQPVGPGAARGYGWAASRDASSGAFGPSGSFRRGIHRSGQETQTEHALAELPIGVDGLRSALHELEALLRDVAVVDFEFSPAGLALVGVRPQPRSSAAALTAVAVDLVTRGVIEPAQAVRDVRPEHVVELLHPRPRLNGRELVLARGLPASPGAASGRVVLSSDDAVNLAAQGIDVVLVATETTPADLPGMLAARGIVTTSGGSASHAAVVARGIGRPAVCGAGSLHVERASGRVVGQEHTVVAGDVISVDGATGTVYLGELAILPADAGASLSRLLAWADGERRLGVRANADSAADARTATALGAQGIGLCRTEHQFLGERLPLIRRVILARDADAESRALEALAAAQREDFRALLSAIGERPVTVRLLDAPMHEFLPHDDHDAEDDRDEQDDVQAKLVASLREANPMLGVRGVRLALLHEGLYPAQVEALLLAWIDVVTADNVRPALEIMVPLVSIPRELAMVAELIERVAGQVYERTGVAVPYSVGTMVETPRAALLAGALAEHAQFISFGTNDLTQLTYGFSRDDVERRLLQPYLERGMLTASPFAELDTEGVGTLMALAVQRARAVRPDIKLGICGEHGGDPASVAFCEALGLDYVSCSPHRVPIARLAAAHARLDAPRDTPK